MDIYEESKRLIVGDEFHVIKRDPINALFAGYDKKVLKFCHGDRMIACRNHITSQFLKKGDVEDFDISSSDNDMKKMHQNKYQNHLRQLFCDEQEREKQSDKLHQLKKKDETLLQKDWACKISDKRSKFLPDFETLEKPAFGLISNYIWSNRSIIAASSQSRICLYHPFNGFTRALDISSETCMAFSHDADFLAIAFHKCEKDLEDQDVYIFKMDQKLLFHSESLKTFRFRTKGDVDISAICYTRDNDHILLGSQDGNIQLYELHSSMKKRFIKYLPKVHKKTVKTITFSCNFKYLGTLDTSGLMVIWNGGSLTPFWLYRYSVSRYYQIKWHPFVEDELILAKAVYPSLFLLKVSDKKNIASYCNWRDDVELSSFDFNPVSGQLAVCFYFQDECINRVSILASMSQVINTFDFDYIQGGLKLFWNDSGTMLGAGGQYFRFAFWSFNKCRSFHNQMSQVPLCTKRPKYPMLYTMLDKKISQIR
ncbi:unnamed protein product [Diamesa hyperborea]